jgi:hypothetical protein
VRSTPYLSGRGEGGRRRRFGGRRGSEGQQQLLTRRVDLLLLLRDARILHPPCRAVRSTDCGPGRLCLGAAGVSAADLGVEAQPTSLHLQGRWRMGVPAAPRLDTLGFGVERHQSMLGMREERCARGAGVGLNVGYAPAGRARGCLRAPPAMVRGVRGVGGWLAHLPRRLLDSPPRHRPALSGQGSARPSLLLRSRPSRPRCPSMAVMDRSDWSGHWVDVYPLPVHTQSPLREAQL